MFFNKRDVRIKKMDLDKTINEALNDSEIKDAIKEQIDLVTEAKSQERVKVLLEDEISKLDTQCDEFKQELKKENEEILNSKIDELEKHCEDYKEEVRKELEEHYKTEQKKFTKELTEKVSEYVDKVVENFLNKHRETFVQNRNSMKVESILEALSAVCAVAGVRSQQITEGTKYLANKDAIVYKQRAENLKAKLLESQQEVIDTQNEMESELSDEKAKTSELEEALKMKARENKLNEQKIQDLKEKLQQNLDSFNELKSSSKKLLEEVENLTESNKELKEKNNSLTESIKTLKTDFRSLNSKNIQLSESVKSLSQENKNLNSENSKILKMGVISEMKQGMTLTEAKRFEQIADQIPFEQTKDYFDKLEVLKEELLNNPKYKKLNEVTDEPETEDNSDSLNNFDLDLDSEQNLDDESSRWDRLV